MSEPGSGAALTAPAAAGEDPTATAAGGAPARPARTRPRRRRFGRAQPEDDSLIQAAAHLGAASAVVLGGFALVKSYAAAHFSLTTGSALLSSAPLAVLLGSVMSYAYWAFPLATLALLSYGVAAWRRRGPSGEVAAALGIAVVTGLLSPWGPLWRCAVPYAVVVVLTVLVPWLRTPKPDPAAALPPGTSAPAAETTPVGTRVVRALPRLGPRLFFVVAVVWMLLSKITNLWVPVELMTVRTASGPQLIVGNVLSDDSAWTTVLRAGDRGLTRVKSGNVESRTVCHLTGDQSPGQRPLLWAWEGRPYQSSNLSCTHLRERHADVPLVPGSLPAANKP